jgi:putative ABC transport system permease protein
MIERLKALFTSVRLDREFDEELRTHLDMLAEENIRRGMDPETARRHARWTLGEIGALREEHRALRGMPWIEGIGQDLRYGVRMLREKPLWSAMAMLTVALAIGANTAIFSVIDAVLLRPLGYPDASRLYVAETDIPRRSPIVFDVEYVAWKDRASSFENLGAFYSRDYTLTGENDPIRVSAARATPSLFDVLRVKAAIGRTFVQGERNLALISNRLWNSRYGGNEAIVGRTLRLNGELYTVIGVLPAAFEFPTARPVEIITPLDPPAATALSNRAVVLYNVIGRLKTGLSPEAAETELDAISSRIRETYPSGYRTMLSGARNRVIGLHRKLVGDIRTGLLVLAGAVAFVLLIACSNVANLLLARAVARRREIAVRIALGVSRFRLTRQLLTEGMLLAGTGALIGMPLAWAGTHALIRTAPPNVPHLASASLDLRVLMFALFATTLSGMVFGLVPVMNLLRSSPESELHGAVKGSGTRSTQRLMSGLIVCQLALATVLLVGAGLLIRTLWSLATVDLGYNPDNLTTMSIALPPGSYRDEHRQRAFFSHLLSRVRATPGVQAAGLAGVLPHSGYSSAAAIEVEHQPPPEGPDRGAAINVVSPGYRQTMGIPLLKGRDLTDSDGPGAPEVAIINERMASRFFDTSDPVGRRIRLGGEQWITVVGVSGNVRQKGLAAEPTPEIYRTLLQEPPLKMSLVVRSTLPLQSIVNAVRAQISAIASDVPLSDAMSMEEVRDAHALAQRFLGRLLVLLAGMSLILAAIGLYSVTHYAVSSRLREIGVRVALGARPWHVAWLVVRRNIVVTLAGVFIGAAGAFALSRTLESMLYGVKPRDTLSFAFAVVIIALAAQLASWSPARRAAASDPLQTLRHD